MHKNDNKYDANRSERERERDGEITNTAIYIGCVILKRIFIKSCHNSEYDFCCSFVKLCNKLFFGGKKKVISNRK